MLKLRNVSKKFGAFTAVDNVSLDVEAGQLVTFLGPSGCGKSTTLRLIAGLEKPTEGEIMIGDDLVAAPAQDIDVSIEKRDLGMVFQSYALWPHMTIFDNVAFPLRAQKLPKSEMREKCESALALVNLSEQADKKPGQLSGGQQQRVALARALASECRLLLFDEPLSNLDVRLRESMRTEIRDIQQRLGITSIYVTHDQSEALAVSDQIVVMNGGKIVQVGSPREIYERPQSEFAATFLGSVNLFRIVSGSRTEDGKQEVTLESGQVIETSEDSETVTGQGEYSLGLRAELLRLSDRNVGTDGNVIPGVVKRVMFLGDSIEYVISTGSGDILARVPPYVQFGKNDEVNLSIHPKDCFVVTR